MRGKVQSIMITALFVCISLLIPSYIYANTEKLAIQVEAQNARVNFQVNDTTLVGQEVSVVCYRPSWDGNYGNWANNTAQIAYLTQIQFENAKPYSFGIGQVEKGDYTLVIGTAGGKLVKKFSFDASVTPIGPAVTQPSQVVAAPGSVKVRQSAANAVKLTWSEVLGAKKYEIYRATKKNGTYKRIATVSSKTSYTNKKLTPGKTYYYKVCAMDGELCVAKKITLMTVLKPKITVKIGRAHV